MRISLFFIGIFSLLINCSVRKHSHVHYLSTLENMKIFPANKQDSMKISDYNVAGQRFREECEKKKNVNCIDDSSNIYLHAQFSKGYF